MGSSVSELSDKCCWDHRPKDYVLKHGTWDLLGRECVIGSLAGGQGYPSWGLYTASQGCYELNQIDTNGEYVYKDHIESVRELEYKYFAGTGGDTSIEADFKRIYVQNSKGNHNVGIYVPGKVQLLTGTTGGADIGKPRIMEYTEDNRTIRENKKKMQQVKAGASGTGGDAEAEGTDSSAVTKSKGETSTVFNIILPMAKLELEQIPSTDKRYVSSVIIGASIKLQGWYMQAKGSKKELDTVAKARLSCSLKSIFSGFDSSVSSSKAKKSEKGPGSTRWTILEQKGVHMSSMPDADNMEQTRKHIYEKLLHCQETPSTWDVLFVDTQINSFLSATEQLILGRFPAQTVAYPDTPPPILSDPFLKEVLSALYKANGTPVEMPQTYTTPKDENPELSDRGGADDDAVQTYEELVSQMKKGELQMEEAAFSFVKEYGYVDDGFDIIVSKYALKFWWSQYRKKHIAERLMDFSSILGKAVTPTSCGPFPDLPSGFSFKNRIRSDDARAWPNQRPLLGGGFGDDDDDDDDETCEQSTQT